MEIAIRCILIIAFLLPVGCGGSNDSDATGPSEGSANVSGANGDPSNIPQSPADPVQLFPDGAPDRNSEFPLDKPVEAAPVAQPLAKPARIVANPLTDEESSRVKALVKELGGANVDVGVTTPQASEELAAMADEAIGPVTSLLSDPDATVRRGAAFFLIDRFNAADDRMVSAFTDSLSDSDDQVRRMAVSLVKRFPSESRQKAILPLAEMLANKDEPATNRAAIARLLGSLEVEASDVAAVLIQSARSDSEPSVRSAALFSLSKIAPPQQAAKVFKDALGNDADASVRRVAVSRLAKLGPAAAIAASDLAAALDDSDDDLRRKAAEALIVMGPDSVAAVIPKLRSTDPLTRRLAVFVLSRQGASAEPALPDLQRIAEDASESEETRKLATFVIRVIGASRQ